MANCRVLEEERVDYPVEGGFASMISRESGQVRRRVRATT